MEAAAEARGPLLAFVTGAFGGDCALVVRAARLAADLQRVGSRYPLVVLVDGEASARACLPPGAEHAASLREVGRNYTLGCYQGSEASYLLAFQKICSWDLTEYAAVLWIDSDVKVRGNIDSLLETRLEGASILGMLNGCPDGHTRGPHPHLGSALLLLRPEAGLAERIVEFSQLHYSSSLEVGAGRPHAEGRAPRAQPEALPAQHVLGDYFTRNGDVLFVNASVASEPGCLRTAELPAAVHCDGAHRQARHEVCASLGLLDAPAPGGLPASALAPLLLVVAAAVLSYLLASAAVRRSRRLVREA
ncbi:unnamed protein product [Prorocentrum cordatum]|uniref:Hexosyltransferase n=1 Tax=Prorocentrum cordatum TaxID=2364126 RepID=A0ABN9S018_9DINO|nr:unnamed protein product [Polarella glacialis]